MIFTSDGGTFNASGMIIDARFSLASWSKTLNQSMSNIVRSPGNSNTIVRFLYALSGSRLKNYKIQNGYSIFLNILRLDV